MSTPQHAIESYSLTPNLSITRAITGLWQIADMEKDGRTLDPVATAQCMEPYANAGLTTFDMADHYGSAEIIAGTFKKSSDNKNIRLLTKWVPKPGPVTREDVRAAVHERLRRLNVERVDLLQYHSWKFSNPFWLDALIYLQELKTEGLIDRKSTRLNSSHIPLSRMPSSA